MGQHKPKPTEAGSDDGEADRPLEIEDIYADLCREFRLKPWEVKRLTRRQIKEIYYRPRPEDDAEPFEYPEPETIEDVQAWCDAVNDGSPAGNRWAEWAPKQWLKEKLAKEEAERAANPSTNGSR